MLIADFPLSNRTKNALIRAGLNSEEDIKDKFLEDIKEVKGLGKPGVLELREYLSSKFSIVLKGRPKKKKIQDPKTAARVVDHLLGHKPKEKIFWGKEMLTANRLLGVYDIDTILKITPDKKVWTLSYYFTDLGRKYIKRFLPTLAIDVKTDNGNSIIEEITEVVELKPVSKPKSIRDFLTR